MRRLDCALLCALAMFTAAACSSSQAPSTTGAGGTGPVQVCTPGEMYQCQCDADAGGRTGGKFCNWDGSDWLTECTLCGAGGTETTATPCATWVDCPGHGEPCRNRSCVNGACVYTNEPGGARPVDLVPNTCQSAICDGYGGTMYMPNPHDCNGTCDSSGRCVEP